MLVLVLVRSIPSVPVPSLPPRLPSFPEANVAEIPSWKVAALLGIKTGTLARWRWEQENRGRVRGPQNWTYRGATAVFYPVEEVEKYLASAGKRTRRDYRRPPGR